MKKLYSIFAALFLVTLGNNVYSQEMVVGGDMESADSWIVIDCTDGANSGSISNEFGFTADGPSDGEGGCFYSNAYFDDGSVNQLVYQEITLQQGVEYEMNLAFKNTVEFNGSWVEVFVGEPEPIVGQDTYVLNGVGITQLGGWKWSDWEGGCSDINDITLLNGDCIGKVGPALSDPDSLVYFEGSGEITVYLGVKFGLGWGNAPYAYELMLDEISLMGPDVAVESATISPQNFVYPNPATDQITMSNVDTMEIFIFDVVGKAVFHTDQISDEMTVDINNLDEGIYILRAGKTTAKFIKR